MLTKSTLSVIASLFLHLPLFTQACLPPNATNEVLAIGTDCPADPATTGYTLNHIALIVNNITATRTFYGDVLGMRHIFTFHASDKYDITYMGYSHGGKNGTGFQTGQQLYDEKTNIEGLMEFLSLRDATNVTASTARVNTFSHVGLIVPDIVKAQDRMQQYGVKIVKGLGANPQPGDPVSQAYGLGNDVAEAMAALAGIKQIGFENFLLVEDPDGNLVEIQQQVS